ncbi:MAG TPA: aminotransferase class V-fold PLP-dependent enzyme, partial [Actinomycetota bacterium]|nr:aminotransferase class V-fold PLP-dependent enzyme [Actinomycetota bacterium]
MAPALDVARIREDFPILTRSFAGRPLVYLDSAATAQKPEVVIEAEATFYREHNANAHRGIYTLGEEATEAYEQARATIARFLGAEDPARLVFTRGTTEAINLVALGWARPRLHEGDEIVLTEMEHHSNIVPWQLAAQATGATLRYIGLTDEGTLDLPADLGSLFTERTRVLAVTAVSNALGTINDVRRLADAAHAAGVAVVVDGAQAAPHLPIDVDALGADFFAFSGHKMLGPTASGGLVATRERLDEMEPVFGGGDMIREVFHDHSTWNDVPFRFEAGTMQVAQQVGLAAAARYLEGLGMDAVRDHERDLTRYTIGRLHEVGATVFGPEDLSVHGGVVAFAYR